MLLKHHGSCAYLRLDGCSHEGLEAAMNAEFDRTTTCDQIPQLQDLSLLGQQELPFSVDCLLLVEAQQFKPITSSNAEGIEPRILQ